MEWADPRRARERLGSEPTRRGARRGLDPGAPRARSGRPRSRFVRSPRSDPLGTRLSAPRTERLTSTRSDARRGGPGRPFARGRFRSRLEEQARRSAPRGLARGGGTSGTSKQRRRLEDGQARPRGTGQVLTARLASHLGPARDFPIVGRARVGAVGQGDRQAEGRAIGNVTPQSMRRTGHDGHRAKPRQDHEQGVPSRSRHRRVVPTSERTRLRFGAMITT